MMNLVHKLRYRFSETYRIRVGGGLDAIRNRREAKALYKFCRAELREYTDERRELNPRRVEVYEHYIRLYRWTFKDLGDDKYFTKSVRKFGISAINVYDFATNYAGWFWS
jgi:hypothetical protein